MEQKTKDEIIDQELPDTIEYSHYDLNDFQRRLTKDCMDIWAESRVVDFDEWKAKNNYRALLDGSTRYAQFQGRECCSDYFTSSELYITFLDSLK